jgi:hypothetical protein
MKLWTLFFVAFMAAVLLGSNAHAEPAAEAASSDAELSAEEVAAKLANPNTQLASLTLKTQLRILEGDLPGADKQEGTMLLFQPSFPFKLSSGDVVFFRPPPSGLTG